MPYEKIGKNEPVCIADEVPFEIPESWEWVRFSSIIELQSGQDMTPDKYNGERLGIPYITGASNVVNGKVVINRWTECGKALDIECLVSKHPYQNGSNITYCKHLLND